VDVLLAHLLVSLNFGWRTQNVQVSLCSIEKKLPKVSNMAVMVWVRPRSVRLTRTSVASTSMSTALGGPRPSPRLVMTSSSGVVPSVTWEYSMGVYRDPNREFDALHADLVGGKINEAEFRAAAAGRISNSE
jgi:hypothetical protein